ncbi:MAG TPA: XdhC family protein [Vicinamibacterales bacterium]|nr:XdhC family protein [Vicinamibacterales bacterium]
MSSIYSRMAELSAAGRRYAVATVVRTQGSTPQVVGARLLVTDDEHERPMGTLGGGCVEADAILTSREVLKHGGRPVRAHALTEELAWNTGLVCGGTMWILAEPGEHALPGPDREGLRDCLHAMSDGPPTVIATLFERVGRELQFAGRVMVAGDGQLRGSLGSGDLDARVAAAALEQLPHGTPRLIPMGETHDLLIEPVAGKPRLVVAGGGHVSQAIARQALLLDFEVTILEDRPEFASPERFGGAHVRTGHVPDTLASLTYGWNSYIVVATRGHKLDGDCVLAAVRTNARYIGLLGSRRKAVLIEDMLREAGVPQARIDAIHTPVGLDLGGRTPAEIALSIMAEITRERYGANAGR